METTKNESSALRMIMTMAWQFVKRNGYNLSKALKCAWANYRLQQSMKIRIVRFHFRKVDGTIREAFGTYQPQKKVQELVKVAMKCKCTSTRRKANIGALKRLI